MMEAGYHGESASGQNMEQLDISLERVRCQENSMFKKEWPSKSY